jgi:hypothetical protein
LDKLVIEKRVRLNFVQHSIPLSVAEPGQISEARYAYYRRCQVFRKNGEQCRAPAEKGASICYAHAGQRAMEFRRDLKRRIVLAEAVAEIRRMGRPEFEIADLSMDFKIIQVTLAVVARALIHDRIDCKTAGRLLVQLQTMSKLLRMHNKGIKTLARIDTDSTDLENQAMAEKTKVVAESTGNAANTRNTKIVAIRSMKEGLSPSQIFCRHGSRPTLLTG